MSNKETNLMNTIRLALSGMGALAFRNNVGAHKTDAGHFVRYGLGEKGGSDIIGCVPVVITPDMVGRTVAVFTAMEVKTKTGRATQPQLNFIAAIKKAGGIAGIVRSPDDAEKLIGEWKHDNC